MSSMLNNIVLTESKGNLNDMSLENNIKKLEIVDTLIKNKHVKNLVVNNIANMYLLSDQCSINNGKFFTLYNSLSGTLLVTNEPIPIILFSPIVIPSLSVELTPKNALFLM